ncbi:MAG TPA: protein kinase [Candidatus Limnocylindria bacterium]|nr:protein kinase [Candidatus Limnocylindria bacterium]
MPRAPEWAAAAPPALDAATLALLERARTLEKHAVGRLISVVEQDADATRPRRAALFRYLASHPDRYPDAARIVGVTGTPGTGKSSLIGRVCLRLLELDPALRIAVLAIDPSSPVTGGALLGDRVRTQFPVGERRIFFRSQASRGDLGGVGRRTFAVTRLLRHLFDLVLIETVGIGQSEIDVTHLSDLTLLVLQPLAGDHVQFMKAGIMEVPDAFVVNKCDEEHLARRSLVELTSALEFAQASGRRPRILQTSAVTGLGIDELAAFLREEAARPPAPEHRRAQEAYFLRKAVAERYGRFGTAEMDRVFPGGTLPPAAEASLEELEDRVLAAIGARIR